MEAVLTSLLPRMLPCGSTFIVHSSGSKQKLLRNLQNRLRGYAAWIPADYRIMVMPSRCRLADWTLAGSSTVTMTTVTS